MASRPAVVARGVVKRFGNVVALDGMDLEVQEGTVLGLLGPNGAGKTTMVRILATLLTADEGTAEVAGIDVAKHPNQVRAAIGLTDAANRPVKTYSGGMRRRLDLAASLVTKPRILFLDEPTTGLDPRSRLGLWEVIQDLVSEGTTVLLTTQYLEEADQLAERVVVIDRGKVIAEGTSEDLKTQVGGDRIEVVVEDPAKLSAAAAALAPISDGAGVSDPIERKVSAPVTGGSTVLVAAVRALDEAQVGIADIVLRRPTLDDVFLSLTGHAAEDETERPEKSKSRRRAR